MEVKERRGVAEVQVAHGNTGQRETRTIREGLIQAGVGGVAFSRDIVDFGDHSWSSETGES